MITAIAAPATLPIMRMTPRDSATASEDRVTIQAEIAAHQGSSECKTSAARAATATDSVGAHMQDNIRALLLQYQCHRKPPLQPDPVRRRRHIGQHFALPLLAADPAGDALDRGTVNMPRVGVEPDPGGMANFHMTDHAFLVIGVNAPGVSVD